MDRILVVDDEKPVRDTLAALLRHEGYRVVVAECGHVAVEAIEAFTFDFIIVDIFMPGMNGLETIKVFCGRCAERADHRHVGICGRQRLRSTMTSSTPPMERRRDLLPAQAVPREQVLDAIAFCRASKALVA